MILGGITLHDQEIKMIKKAEIISITVKRDTLQINLQVAHLHRKVDHRKTKENTLHLLQIE